MPNIQVAKYLDVAIEYDPDKKIFCAEVEGKRLTHKKQTRLEVMIKKAVEVQHPKWRGRKPGIKKMRCYNSECGSDKVNFVDKGERVHCNACNLNMPWIDAYEAWKKIPKPPKHQGRKLREDITRFDPATHKLIGKNQNEKKTPTRTGYSDADFIKDNDNVDVASQLLLSVINRHTVNEGLALESFITTTRMQLTTTISMIKTLLAAITAGRK